MARDECSRCAKHAALVHGTPFFAAEGNLSSLLSFASADRVMPASLWAPIFHRPDLVKAALAGHLPEPAALGLDTYAACEAALSAERVRLGLVKRRAPSQ